MNYDEVETTQRGLVFYHRTSSDGAAAICGGGFKDRETVFGGISLNGVWMSNRPLDRNEGTATGPLLRILIRVELADLADLEVVNDDATYREWCVPAAWLNARAVVEVVADEDELPEFVFPEEWFQG